jgi:hypothetical protein
MTHTATDREAGNATLTARLAAAFRDPRHHRALVLAANAGLVACGAAEPLTPALVLYFLLLPFNGWRLLHALRTGSPVRPLPATTLRADVQAARRKAASTRLPAFDARATMQTIRLSPRAAQ